MKSTGRWSRPSCRAPAGSAIPPSRSKRRFSSQGARGPRTARSASSISISRPATSAIISISNRACEIEEIAGAPERLDNQLLNSFVSHHESGFDVLASPRSGFRERELSVELLSALFELLAQRYSEIVIDLPLARHPWTSPVLAASQGILVTGRNTIPGLRQIAETLEAIQEETAITGAVRAVVNDCEVNLIGRIARLDHVERVLGMEKPFLVAHSDAAVECVNAGTPMTIARRSEKAVKDIAAIVQFCVELKATAATARG